MGVASLVIGLAAFLHGAAAQPPAPNAPGSPASAAPGSGSPATAPPGSKTPPADPPVPTPPVPPAPIITIVSFDSDALGKLPEDWKVMSTNQYGPASAWEIVADKSAPSRPNVLAPSKDNHAAEDARNLCWTDKTRFKEGILEVKFRLGDDPQARNAGVIWRIRDKNNYLLARVDAGTNSVRVGYLKDGLLRDLESRSLRLDPGDWHTLRIEHTGLRIICSVDGVKRFDVRDNHADSSGGIGLWTGGNAFTSFDDFRIEQIEAAATPVSPVPERSTPKPVDVSPEPTPKAPTKPTTPPPSKP